MPRAPSVALKKARGYGRKDLRVVQAASEPAADENKHIDSEKDTGMEMGPCGQGQSNHSIPTASVILIITMGPGTPQRTACF